MSRKVGESGESWCLLFAMVEHQEVSSEMRGKREKKEEEGGGEKKKLNWLLNTRRCKRHIQNKQMLWVRDLYCWEMEETKTKHNKTQAKVHKRILVRDDFKHPSH